DFFGPGLPVPGVRFTHNTVTCSPGACIFLAGTSGAVVSNNTFTSPGSVTGVHVQLGVEDLDSVRIEGNTVVATAPSTDFRFGGIRLVGARHAVVRDNIVTGPWANALRLASLSMSIVTENHLNGAAVYGIGLTRNPFLTAFVLNSTFRSNVVTGAASGGVFARKACGNVFVGNNLQGNGSNIGLIFPDTSGANTVVGNPSVIVDNGAYDCNGDGVNDPNIITGAGAVMHGVNVGPAVSEAIVSSNVVLNKTKGQNAGWIVITAGWGFGVTVAVYAVGTFSGAHLNPAVTIGLASIGKFAWASVPVYIAAQMLGAFLGAAIVWLAYLPHWAVTDNPSSKLAVFCTGPAIRNPGANLLTEIIGTIILVLGVLAILTPKNLNPAHGWDVGFGPCLVGIIVWAIGLSLGGPTGYAINPARDLGPRIAHAILPIPGKGASDWGYAWIPIAGPIIGGLIAAFLYKVAWSAT